MQKRPSENICGDCTLLSMEGTTSGVDTVLSCIFLVFSTLHFSPLLVFPFSVPSLLSCRTFSSLFSYHHLCLLFPPSLLLSCPPALLPSCPPALLPSCPPPLLPSSLSSCPALPCPARFGFAQYGLTYIFWCLTLPGSFSSIPWPEAVFCVFRGVCLYRTVKTHELILKGIPDILRAEVWLVFSGAINEVWKEECLLCCSLTNKQTNKQKQQFLETSVFQFVSFMASNFFFTLVNPLSLGWSK